MAINGKIAISEDAQKHIVDFVNNVVSTNSLNDQIRNKMEAIDIAYARYCGGDTGDGVDDNPADTSCGDVFQGDNVIPPIVASQVDSHVAYLADVFLSGYPIFPVASSPLKRGLAEKLEVLLDDHATLGGYVRQIYLMLKNGIKYNISAMEVAWTQVEQFSVEADFTNEETGSKTTKAPKGFNALKNLDMYNVVWDQSVAAGDVAKEGDFAGYVEIITKTKLKRLLEKLPGELKNINAIKALSSHKILEAGSNAEINYHYPPVISEYIKRNKSMDWGAYMGFKANKASAMKGNLYDGSKYEKVTLYARILPSDLKISAPAKNTPQIWKFVLINGLVLIEAERILSAYDYLPILFGQPLEDGLAYQTQSVAEGAIPFQKAASTLYNIRFSAARRAVSDRALFDVDMINPTHVNSKASAAKIPVRIGVLGGKTLAGSYMQIPFDMRGTETALNDATLISNFSQELSGLNNAQKGQFQKGNKSVTEFDSVMSNSDNKLRLPAMLYEAQVFMPLKQMLTLNIFQFGEDAVVISQRTGQEVNINLQELRTAVLSFKVADGYTAKSKIASTEMIANGMNMISQSPILQEAYGQMLPAMFAHLMQLAGVRDLDQYTPQQALEQGAEAGQLQGASLQEGQEPITQPSTPPAG